MCLRLLFFFQGFSIISTNKQCFVLVSFHKHVSSHIRAKERTKERKQTSKETNSLNNIYLYSFSGAQITAWSNLPYSLALLRPLYKVHTEGISANNRKRKTDMVKIRPTDIGESDCRLGPNQSQGGAVTVRLLLLPFRSGRPTGMRRTSSCVATQQCRHK